MSVGAAGLRLHGLNAFTEQQPQEIVTVSVCVCVLWNKFILGSKFQLEKL